MTIAKISFSTVLFLGLSAGAVNAAPFSPGSGMANHPDIVQAQYHHHDHARPMPKYRPMREVCKTEMVQRWVRGRLVRERVERCRPVRG